MGKMQKTGMEESTGMGKNQKTGWGKYGDGEKPKDGMGKVRESGSPWGNGNTHPVTVLVSIHCQIICS